MRVTKFDCVAKAELDSSADAHAELDPVFDASGLTLSLGDTALVKDSAGDELTDLETPEEADSEGDAVVEGDPTR